MVWTLIGAVAAVAWIGLLLLPWQPWRTRERLEPLGDAADLSDVTVIIPARNEAEALPRTLEALRGMDVVVVDDNSSDGTADMARKAGARVVSAPPLPDGWAGKLWALENGRNDSTSRLLLLLDADIELSPGMAPALKRKLDSEGLDLVSVMAVLRMENLSEKVFVPAFVYFFKLLYPFAKSNSPASRVAAAAGGCILLKRDALEKIGGFAAIRNALIDDCALAARFKAQGFRTWIGLTHGAHSHRPYTLGSFWNMVARSAFTQLQYSPIRLMAATCGLLILFAAPFGSANVFSAVTAGAMVLSYLPMLRFYGRAPFWVLLLPIVATLYLAMTWTSAIRYWQGRRAEWKGRVYYGGLNGKTLPPGARTN